MASVIGFSASAVCGHAKQARFAETIPEAGDDIVFQICCSHRVTMARFQTVIRRARFVYSPYTATEMQGFAEVLADSIRARIQSGRNIYEIGRAHV